MKNLLFALCCLLALPTWASTQDVSQETFAYGDTYQAALAQALLEAVSQARGIEVGTRRQLQVDFEQLIQNQTVIQHSQSNEYTDVFVKSKGFIKNYRIVQVIQPKAANEAWYVKVQATVPTYDLQADDQRKRLAIIPMYSDDALFADQNGQPLSKRWVAERLTDSLVAHFTQSNRFAVLDFQHSVDLSLEYQALKSSQISPEQSARIGQALSADYLLVSDLDGIKASDASKSFYGMQKNASAVGMSVTYRLIDVRTQHIVWANSVARVLVNQEVNFDKSSQGTIAKGTWFNTFDQMAGPIVTDIMQVTFPMRILDVIAADAVYVNQGGLRLNLGDKLTVFNHGFKVVDADIQLPIEIDGTEVATLEVTHVFPKYSVAKITRGSVKSVHTQNLVRLIENTSDTPEAKPDTTGSSEQPLRW